MVGQAFASIPQSPKHFLINAWIIALMCVFLFLIETGIHKYINDFDKNGVVYALATNFGRTKALRTTIMAATRSSNEEGDATDILENCLARGIVSGTSKDEEQSWWCVDLTEKYALYLTHYSLRHGCDKRQLFLRNWRLEGSLDGHCWRILSRHKNDRGLKGKPYCTCTWRIHGKSHAFRFFRIFQTGKNSSGKFGIFLSGIELYGVLIEQLDTQKSRNDRNLAGVA